MLHLRCHVLFDFDQPGGPQSDQGMTVPMKAWQYCRRFKLDTNSAQSSGLHSVMMVRGRLGSSPAWPKVVGVCSLDWGSEEVSESVCNCVGEVMTLLSYSSSASESA